MEAFSKVMHIEHQAGMSGTTSTEQERLLLLLPLASRGSREPASHVTITKGLGDAQPWRGLGNLSHLPLPSSSQSCSGAEELGGGAEGGHFQENPQVGKAELPPSP